MQTCSRKPALKGPKRGWRGVIAAVLPLILATPMLLAVHSTSLAREGGAEPDALALSQAVMCEEVRDLSPVNVSVVFSVDIGKVSCYTLFDPVPEKTVVYHTWFYRDRESTRKRLTLKSPRWSTFSSIQLREADKGPWHVIVSDEAGHVYGILRFSVTD